MHSVKVTFNDDYKHRQLTVSDGQNWREGNTDDLGHRGAPLRRDEGDQVEGENLIEMPIIRFPCRCSATREGYVQVEDVRRRRLPGP